ncbi:quinon protein alcohol dehydrogenase-like superfamily [Cokeromyces recurvatus]|uniref:quinon protein alcohol dehydrogenase-like superfamily n=1 Tax=Cokeromyces recurvatus TaxID=90255 RepID=UPI002220A4A4|nr:quinon protein alcohol dehydrogenase-like superfamily [Cokeromyces recurvatus]KAI7900323.1 quinon protein alcohol dehydrogenase-like superfamily [Cokeromyces recurvatus]
MEEHFPVNPGNVPPPSQSTNLLIHQLNHTTFQTSKRRTNKKSKETITSKLKLERILGLTTTSSNILATSNDLIAYAAGAVVVIYNHKRNKQVAFLYPPPISQSTLTNNTNNGNSNIINTTVNNTIQQMNIPISTIGGNITTNNMLNNEIMIASQNKSNNQDEKKSTTPASIRAKPISCLTFSTDGRYLAAGEMGHQPRIFIWDVKEKNLIREFRSHKFGVLTLAFSPNKRYLVSIGFQHDGYLYVWDWKKGTKIAGNKVTSRVNAVSFSQDGSYFVTAGLRHVKFWYLNKSSKGNISSRETQVLDGRSGILGVLRDGNFVNVTCDKSSNTGYTYFITDTGILCTFKEGRVLDKWVDLQVKSAYSIAISENYIICSCSEGIVRLFEPVTLKYVGILPKPHPLGIDISSITSPEMIMRTEAVTHYYPDALAMAYDDYKVIITYSDRSLYVWDIHDLEKIGKYRSFIFHSDCVWGVEAYPRTESSEEILQNSFATFSADGTIRFWNLDNFVHTTSSTSSTLPSAENLTQPISSNSSTSTNTTNSQRRNIYSRELIKMLYVDPDAAEFAKLKGDIDFTAEDQCPDFGIRSLKISSDGQLMASGDRNGNLRVYNMNNWEILTYLEAHDSEILSIDITTSKEKDAPNLIATASRDRLLHIFDIKSNFQIVQSLDDHSSSITAVKFSKDATKLISCSADKSIIFRHCTNPPLTTNSDLNTIPQPYSTYHNYSGRSTVFDMALDINGKHLAAVTGERKLYALSLDSGKPFRVCKPETAEEILIGKVSENSGGSLINIDLDPFSGTFAVTSGSDRCIRLFDLVNNTCIEKVCAHAELITGVKFIYAPVNHDTTGQDDLRVVSTCSDSTIFIWRVSCEIVAKMRARGAERDLKSRQRNCVVDEDAMDHIINKQMISPSGGIPSVHKNKRLGRISITTNTICPSASLSQMVRQGDRNTFSTMSPAEHKYDELYKKIASGSRKKKLVEIDENNSNTDSSTHLINNNKFFNKPLSFKKENRMSNTQTTLLDNNGRKSPPDNRSGRLDRLYNGLPTSNSPRERTLNQVSHLSLQQRLQQSSGPSIITGRVKSNRILRHALSRDAIIKKEQPELFKRPSTTVYKQEPILNDSHVVNSNLPVVKSEKRRVSAPQIEVSTLDDQDTCEEEEEVTNTDHTTSKSFIEEGSDSDTDFDTSKDGEEEKEDDDDNEEEIIFTPEQDKMIKPFEVSLHEGISSSTGDEEEQHASALLDNEANGTSNNDEEGSNSEDNIDDVINRNIVAREPPPISISLSRTQSYASINKSRRRHTILFDCHKNDQQLHDSPSSSSSSPLYKKNGGYERSPIDDEAFSLSNNTLKEIQKKMQRASKRQSVTSRFLSSLGGGVMIKSVDERLSPNQQRPSLNYVLNSFQELSPKRDALSLPLDDDDSLIQKLKTTSIDETKQAKDESSHHEQQLSSKKQIGDDDNDDDESDNKLEGALANLDSAFILLENVLQVYSLSKKNNTTEVAAKIETKLNNIVDKITQSLQQEPKTKENPTLASETALLLEKYSNLLVNMVENKLNDKTTL